MSAADSLKSLIEATEHTAQEYKIVGGAQQVSQKLAACLPSLVFSWITQS